MERHHVAASVAYHTLGFARGSRCVENVEGVGRLHRRRLYIGNPALNQLFGPVEITTLLHLDRHQTTVEHEHIAHTIAICSLKGAIHNIFERNWLTFAHARVSGHDQHRFGIIDP